MQLIDFFDKGAERFPDVDVIHDGARGWTYTEMQTLTKRTASALLAQGLNGQSVAATFAPNHAMAFAAQYGVLRSGTVWLPLHVRNSVDENIAVLKLMDTEWLFFHSQYEGEIARVREALPSLRGCVCIDGDSAHGPSLDRFIEGHGVEGAWIEKGAQDVIAILATSGTTGLPKGVELTNLNWETMIASYQISMPYGDTRPIQIVAAPLSHAAGCLTASLLSLGVTNVLLPKPDPLAILEAIEKHKATTLFMPPTLIYMLLSHPRLREFDYSSLRYFMYGASPMSVQKLKEATDAFGPVMCQTFGQTEALIVLTFMTPADHAVALSDPNFERRLWSAGRAAPLAKVAVMDDGGRILPIGERGEIVCRSNLVMKGYYKNPKATEDVSSFGWHHTGDIGALDEDGFVYIVDRKKDMIISGGFNVFPSEVEQVLWAHPAIKDCAVIGIPHEKWGEAVTAVIELKDGAVIEEAALIQFCKDKLGSVKAPKSVVVVEALPRSSVGKVLKRELRARFWQGRERAI